MYLVFKVSCVFLRHQQQWPLILCTRSSQLMPVPVPCNPFTELNCNSADHARNTWLLHSNGLLPSAVTMHVAMGLCWLNSALSKYSTISTAFRLQYNQVSVNKGARNSHYLNNVVGRSDIFTGCIQPKGHVSTSGLNQTQFLVQQRGRLTPLWSDA